MNSNERSIMVLTMIAHGMVHVYELSVPILIGEWKAEFAAAPSSLGWVVFFGYAVFGLGSIPAGILADRYDSQFLLALCLGGMGASFLFIGFTPWFSGIGVFFFLWGIFASIHHPTSLSLISRSVSRRGSGFAYHGMAGNVGIALGPLFTTVLLMMLEWRTVTVILALPALFAVIFQLWISFDEEKSQAPENPAGSAERVQFQINSISEDLTIAFVGVNWFYSRFFRRPTEWIILPGNSHVFTRSTTIHAGTGTPEMGRRIDSVPPISVFGNLFDWNPWSISRR